MRFTPWAKWGNACWNLEEKMVEIACDRISLIHWLRADLDEHFIFFWSRLFNVDELENVGRIVGKLLDSFRRHFRRQAGFAGRLLVMFHKFDAIAPFGAKIFVYAQLKGIFFTFSFAPNFRLYFLNITVFWRRAHPWHQLRTTYNNCWLITVLPALFLLWIT